MNYRNFDKRENGRIPADGNISFSGYAPESENKCESVEDDFNIFLEIAEILAEREYRKRRFLKIFKISVSAISAVLAFAGIFIFAKKRRTGKGAKTKKIKI